MDFYTKCVKARYNDFTALADKDPLYLNVAYAPKKGFLYQRYGSQNTLSLRKAISTFYNIPLENCNLISNGMLALKTIFDFLYKTEDHCLIAHDIYSETHKMIDTFDNNNIEFIEIDNYELLKSKIRNNTKFILFDTMVNPTNHRHDVKAIVKIAKSINSNIKIIVDNTMLSIYYYNPFDDNADIVVESLTKYYNGHGDALGGVILGIDLKEYSNTYGIELDPMSSWLILRGISTFPLRMDRITNTANIIYQELQNITNGMVKYNGVGGIIMFTFGSEKNNKKFLFQINKYLNARTTFGQENTLCNVNWELDAEIKWLPEEWKHYLRLSVGLESPEFIIENIRKAYYLAKHNK